MTAILTWFTGFFLKEAAKEVFRKVAMIIAFNIALAFIISWVGSHAMAGLSFFGVGDAVTQAIVSLGPAIGYWWNYFNVGWAVFLCLNAILFRFVFDIHMTALGAAR